MKTKVDYRNSNKDIFYQIIYPLFAEQFLFGNNYETFASLVSEKFILNAIQWEYILDYWNEKENLLSE